MAQRAAQARAQRFLWYRRTAPLLSILLAPFSGLLLVVMLSLGGMLLDLAVSRGIVNNVQTARQWADQRGHDAETQAILKMVESRQGLGLTGVAIRTHHTWLGGIFQNLADAFPALRNNFYYLVAIVLSLMAASLLYSLVTFLQKRLSAAAAVDATTRLRRSVHNHAYRIGDLTLRNVSKGQVVGTSMRVLDSLQAGLYYWFARTFHEPLNFLWLLAFLLGVDVLQGGPWASIILLAAAALYWLMASWITSRVRRAERTDILKAAEGQRLLLESMSMLRLVKSYGMEAYNRNRLERLLHRQANAVRSRWFWYFFSRHGRGTILVLLVTIVGLAMVGKILDGEVRFTLLVMMLMTIALMYLVLRRWHHAWQQTRRTISAAGAVFQLLDKSADVKQVVGAEFLPPLTERLDLVNVGVVTETDEVLVSGVNLTIAAGEHVAIVGDERGRLTLAYLLPRLIDPDQGDVRIDRKPLPWVTLESVRRQIALVLQDDLVFNDTVANNIGCGDEKLTLPQIIEAAKTAHAHNFIMKLPGGYDTRIGDLGEPLTASQQFRIALARAVLRDPSVVVLEEPAGVMSDEDKAWLDDTMTRFLKGRTAIVLATRLSTLRRVDRVVMMHLGAVIDEGPDQELYRKCPRYKHWLYMNFHQFQDGEE
jgi:ATP-binding cassette, subfamily B, bacterial